MVWDWIGRLYGYALYACVGGFIAVGLVGAILVLIVVPILLAFGVELPHWESPACESCPMHWTWGDL